jgi:cytochrome bd-type quinol oxidase subunit 2
MLHLHTLWFVIVAFFWTGFFVLEGFDFGVGMLHVFVGRDEDERSAALSTISPVWDGNEVWLIVAGAGMFAAFPGWYATMFSSLYLALLLVLAGLMARGVSLEFREKLGDARWRRGWRVATIAGSALVPLLLGVGLGDLLHGLPVNAQHNYTGNFLDLLSPYGLMTGVTLLLLSLLHGAAFLSLRTTGPVRERAAAAGKALSWPTALFLIGFLVWTRAEAGVHFPTTLIVLGAFAVLFAAYLIRSGHDGWAFAATAVAIATAVGSIFVALYPNVLISTTNSAYNLTVSNSSSAHYALTAMTIVSALLLPIVIVYQGWSYHVFRARVRSGPIDTGPAAAGGGPATPAGGTAVSGDGPNR